MGSFKHDVNLLKHLFTGHHISSSVLALRKFMDRYTAYCQLRWDLGKEDLLNATKVFIT
jgi:hypothetical protein